MLPLILNLVFALIVWRSLKKSKLEGFRTGAFFLVFTPIDFQFELGGGLPVLTFHRVVILILLFAIAFKTPEVPLREIRYLPHMATITGCYLVSAMLAEDHGESLKFVSGYVLETICFYICASKAIRTREDAVFVSKGILAGLFTVGTIAWVEKYGGIRLSELTFGGPIVDGNDIYSTFPHRILLGYATSVGVVLACVTMLMAETRKARLWALICMGNLAASCYFAGSRGPWFAFAVSLMILFLIGPPGARKLVGTIVALGCVLIIVRPGVMETVRDRSNASFDNDTIEGKSASYRLELWGVAMKKISTSTGRTLFGYGGLSTEHMDLGNLIKAGPSAKGLGFTSIDNQYAKDIIEGGLVTFTILCALYLRIVRDFVRLWAVNKRNDGFVGGLLICVITFIFSYSTVAMFSPQYKFIFWMLVASGTAVWNDLANPQLEGIEEQECPQPTLA